MRINYLIVFLIGFILTSCDSEFLPKPKGYNRIDLPLHEYTLLADTLPYRFEYSSHAEVLKDTSWISEDNWIEIYYPDLKADIHITYKSINNDEKLLREFLEDAYTLTAKHQIKAYAIDDIIMTNPRGMTFSIAELDGEVPSQFQFICTDSVNNFLRGALHFNIKVNNDSLRPAIEYVKLDIIHMMNTLEWTN